jgi:hypothetical protein
MPDAEAKLSLAPSSRLWSCDLPPSPRNPTRAFGIIGPVSRHRVVELERALAVADEATVPALAREALQTLVLTWRLQGQQQDGNRSNRGSEHPGNPLGHTPHRDVWGPIRVTYLGPRST